VESAFDLADPPLNLSEPRNVKAHDYPRLPSRPFVARSCDLVELNLFPALQFRPVFIQSPFAQLLDRAALGGHAREGAPPGFYLGAEINELVLASAWRSFNASAHAHAAARASGAAAADPRRVWSRCAIRRAIACSVSATARRAVPSACCACSSARSFRVEHGLEPENEALHDGPAPNRPASRRRVSSRDEGSWTPCRRNARTGSIRPRARSIAGLLPGWYAPTLIKSSASL
jgi:hypothetical protein